MTMDFLERLVELLDSQGYYATVVSPILTDKNSISVMTMPGNDYQYYYDGSYRQGYDFQVMTKHTGQLTAYHTLLTISQFLQTVPDIKSESDSYNYEGLAITTSPNVIGKDEKYYIYAAQFKAALFIPNIKE